uniref:Uncharacterized protein n=1 Tax=Arundo donax TaxID=35708 RepID=A0A0A9ES69_ARUDO
MPAVPLPWRPLRWPGCSSLASLADVSRDGGALPQPVPLLMLFSQLWLHQDTPPPSTRASPTATSPAGREMAVVRTLVLTTVTPAGL